MHIGVSIEQAPGIFNIVFLLGLELKALKSTKSFAGGQRKIRQSGKELWQSSNYQQYELVAGYER